MASDPSSLMLIALLSDQSAIAIPAGCPRAGALGRECQVEVYRNSSPSRGLRDRTHCGPDVVHKEAWLGRITRLNRVNQMLCNRRRQVDRRAARGRSITIQCCSARLIRWESPFGIAAPRGEGVNHHIKKLMYTVRIGQPDPNFAQCGMMPIEKVGFPRLSSAAVNAFMGYFACHEELQRINGSAKWLNSSVPISISRSLRSGSSQLRP
jgi:hypothetical protein